MKLELKHLAPYLPYGLKVLGPNSPKDIRDLKPSTINVVLDDVFGPQMKPVLRPLRDLKGSRILDKYAVFNKQGDAHDIDGDTPYAVYIFLIKNHYDLFGLIDKGLAIDINTLQS